MGECAATAQLLDAERHRAGHDAPEGRADTSSVTPESVDQEGDERGLAVRIVAHSGGQTATDGAEQGQPGDGRDQFLGEGSEQDR